MLKKIDNKAYLIGTMHVMPEGFMFNKEVLAAIRDSDKLVVECKCDDIPMESVMIPDGKQLADVVTSKTFISIKRFAAACTMSPWDEEANNLRPWAVLAGLLTFLYTQFGYTYHDGMESKLKRLFSGKTIVEAEVIKQQLNIMEDLFAGLTEDQFIKELVKGFAAIQSMEEVLQKSMGYILDGKYSELSKYLSADDGIGPMGLGREFSMAPTKREQAILLDDRHGKMVESIEENMKDGKCFIAFGAAHLGGVGGVLHRLHANGHTIS